MQEALNDFTPCKYGAHATCRLLGGAESDMNPQEWCEPGEINGAPAKVYYIFEDVTAEDASDYPWNLDHVDRIEVAELDDEGQYEKI